MTLPRDPEYPRPQHRRADWTSLDGEWDFALDIDAEHRSPGTVDFDRRIRVPFAPETPASGIATTEFVRRCWYRRSVDVPDIAPGHRLLVHFGAVDRSATVWADGHQVGRHQGGFTPFSVDLTDIATGPTVELVVRADDDPRRLDIPRGKQDWEAEPHLIWYPRTTGIWQSVWMEVVPPVEIAGLTWTGDPATATVGLAVDLAGAIVAGDRLAVTLSHGERTLTADEVTVTDVVDSRAHLERSFRVGRPGIDDSFDLIWRPNHPALIDATIELRGQAGTDTVWSYTALRSVEVTDGRVELNGRVSTWRLALDQGYWPESGMTAPSVEHLRRDVALVKELGLTGVRKHQKVEDPRWLALCDEAGVLVWEELPSAFAWSPDLPATLATEWSEVVRRDRSHPCIVAWVPINESWAVYDTAGDVAQRATISALAALTQSLDPTRPVSANDGWETIGGQIVGVHDYDQDGDRLATRYADDIAIDRLFDGVGPSRRPLTADGSGRAGRAVLVTELGGATLEDDPSGVFSYGNLTTEEDYLERVASICRAVLRSDSLSGYCWTQLTDTYQERNGLVRADRTAKVPIDALARALRGSR